MSTSIFLSMGIGVIILLLFVCFCLISIRSSLRKVGPNQALIVYGAGGVKVITGGSHMVLALYQRAQYFSLELMSLEIPFVLALERERPVNVQATVLIKVRAEEQSILVAAERFLSKSQQEQERLIRIIIESHLHAKNNLQEYESPMRLVVEGHLYEMNGPQEYEYPVKLFAEGKRLGHMEQAGSQERVRDLETLRSQISDAIVTDLDKIGFEMVSFLLKEVDVER